MQLPHWIQSDRSYSCTLSCIWWAPWSHKITHSPHRIQRSGKNWTSCRGFRPSGLWHQKQCNGQPLRKTVVRIPGPSCVENRCILKTKPVRGCTGYNYKRGSIFWLLILRESLGFSVRGSQFWVWGWPRNRNTYISEYITRPRSQNTQIILRW